MLRRAFCVVDTPANRSDRRERGGEHAPGVPFAYIEDPNGYVIDL
jgi:hypothetical protein